MSGSFTVVATGGFTGSINFSGQGQGGNQTVMIQFSPNQVSVLPATVNFTVPAPTTGVSGPTPFTLVLTGRDTSGAITATANATLSLQPTFSLSVTPGTTSSSPAPVTQNSTLPVTVQIVAGTGFTGTVVIDFPNLPAGFSVSSGNLTAGTPGSFSLSISAAAVPGPALITVRGTSSFGITRTATLFLNVISDFSLSVTPATSATNPVGTVPGGTLRVVVQVVPISGFAGTVAIDFTNLPAGFTAAGGNVAAGATATFSIQNNLQAGPTVFQITIRGRVGTDVQTILLFVIVQQPILIQPVPSPVAAAQATVYAVEPAKLNAGNVVDAKLYGANLSGVTAIQVSGSGITAELLESAPSELRVRLTADPGVQPGSHLITVRAGASKATVVIDVSPGSRTVAKAPLAPPQVAGVGNRLETRDAAESPSDESLRAPQLASPTPATEPTVDRSASQGDGGTGNSVAHAGLRQRGDLRLTVGGCTGFRLTSGAEQSCGGSADFEVSSRGDGSLLVIEAADGVRNLGGFPLDQAEGAPGGTLSSSEALLAGNTYVVQTHRGMAVVRVLQIRGMESVRNAPPAVLRGPRLGGPDREVQGNSGRPELKLVLEWKILQP